MPYLIDGNNLIGHIPFLEIGDSRSRRQLADMLAAFLKEKKTKIILVFDGPPDPDLYGEKYRERALSVLFPFPGESADSLIKEKIEAQTDRRRFIVVSSDHELRSFARKNRTRTVSCAEFFRELKRSLARQKKSRSEEKEEVALSPLDLKYWEEVFEKNDA